MRYPNLDFQEGSIVHQPQQKDTQQYGQPRTTLIQKGQRDHQQTRRKLKNQKENIRVRVQVGGYTVNKIHHLYINIYLSKFIINPDCLK